MKIHEIVSEAIPKMTAGQAVNTVGRGAGNVVGGVARGIGKAAGIAAGAAPVFKAGFKQGQAKMDKLLSPSKWFGGDDDTAAGSTSKNSDTLQQRQSLSRAAEGKPLYKQDLDTMAGMAKEAPDANTQQALKAAAAGQQLSDQQRQLLAQYSKQF